MTYKIFYILYNVYKLTPKAKGYKGYNRLDITMDVICRLGIWEELFGKFSGGYSRTQIPVSQV